MASLFKVIPLESNALFHPSLPRFYALLEGFFWDAPQLHCYGPLDGLHTIKMGPLDDPLQLGEQKKNHAKQDQVNREVVPVQQCSSWAETAGSAGCYGQVHCCGEAATICPTTTLVSSRALSEAIAAGSLCRLAD